MEIENNDYALAYKDDSATKQVLFDKIVAFFMEHKCFSGESYAQRDAPQIGSMDLMCEIADDVLQFRATWK